jgi:DNA-binding NtrC family response regulator
MNEKDVFLIVDDEPDMCWALQHVLKGKGLLSKTALSGHEALALMREHRFHCIFLDAKLPDIDGLELAKLFKEVDPNIRIVLVSGYFYKDDTAVENALSQGLIIWFIGKPFSHHEIRKAIDIAQSV